MIYEGGTKVKQAKLETPKGHFENLKMKQEESIGECLLRVDEVVNTIRGLGEQANETIIVQKVHRSYNDIRF